MFNRFIYCCGPITADLCIVLPCDALVLRALSTTMACIFSHDELEDTVLAQDVP
jgi:hypothetical protein